MAFDCKPSRDLGEGARSPARKAALAGKFRVVAMDRKDDMLPFIEDGTIQGSVTQKSDPEAFLAVHLLHWLNTGLMKVVADWRAAGINPLPEKITTGVMPVTRDNVASSSIPERLRRAAISWLAAGGASC
jgi:ribose transport system substrate-binding protein